MPYSGNDDDDTTTGPIDTFFNYQLEHTKVKTWHVMLGLLILGFVLGTLL